MPWPVDSGWVNNAQTYRVLAEGKWIDDVPDPPGHPFPNPQEARDIFRQTGKKIHVIIQSTAGVSGAVDSVKGLGADIRRRLTSANAVTYSGATPFFVDATADTWTIDPALRDRAIHERREAGATVHAGEGPSSLARGGGRRQSEGP